MKPRKYQQDAANNVVKEWKEVQSTLVVIPTGGGKTILAADICRRVFPKRVLFIAHRKELILQGADKIHRATGYRCDVEMGELRAVMDGDMFSRPQVVVASVQTLTAGGDGSGRMTKFAPTDFDVIIVDEAHRITASTYRRVLDYFKQNPRLKVMGITATPDRADEEALGQLFDTVAFDYEILDAIEDGWIVPVRQQVVDVAGLDFSEIRTTAGDLNGGDLAEVMEQEKNLIGIADVLNREVTSGRRALVFCVSVAQAERQAEILNRYGRRAAFVCGMTDPKEREQTNRSFASGDIEFLCNVGTHTEGFDDTGVTDIGMARATKSRALYAQCLGRSLRPHDSIVAALNAEPDSAMRRQIIANSCKPHATIYDFVGNSGKHKLVTSADILGGKVSDEAIKRAVAKARKSGKAVNMAKELSEAEEEIRAEQERQRRLADEAQRRKLTAKAKYTTKLVDPFDVLDIQKTVERGWDAGHSLTVKQKDILQKQGIDYVDLKYHEQKQLLNAVFERWGKNLCSFKQAKLLKKFGFNGDVSVAEAKRTIDAIAQNGWKRPANFVQNLETAT